MLYQKKSVHFEAFKYDGDLIDRNGQFYVPEWAVKAFNLDILYYNSIGDGPPCNLFIRFLDRSHLVEVGDYVFENPKGGIYCCDGELFEQMYEPVI